MNSELELERQWVAEVAARGKLDEPIFPRFKDNFHFYKDHSYFNAHSKANIIHILAQRERDGTLKDWLTRVAPDYVEGDLVLSFSLAADLKLGKPYEA